MGTELAESTRSLFRRPSQSSPLGIRDARLGRIHGRGIPSTLVSYVFAEIIFDRVWSFHWGLPISISLVVIALSVLTAGMGHR